MTLVISTRSRRFRRQVASALREICPCFTFNVAANGIVTARQIRGRDEFCKCYCAHRAGCNLISDLINHAQRVTIRRTGRGNSHNPRRRRVRWNPIRRRGGRNARGDRRRPPSVGLAHELIHAHHTINGNRGQGRTNGIPNEEINTSRGENQIRREMGEPQRTHYGRRRIPNPGQGNIDASDRHRCGCGLFARIVRGIKLFFKRIFSFFGGRKEEKE